MTISNKKINFNNTVSQSANIPASGSIFTINNFDDLILALVEPQVFTNYVIENPNIGVLGIKYNNKLIIILKQDIWRDDQKIKDYISEVDNENVFLVCAGDHEEWNIFTQLYTNHDIFYLSFPCNIYLLRDYLNIIFGSANHLESVYSKFNKSIQNEKYIKYILSISRELNGIRDIDKLLDLILKKAREITYADAGSLYIIEYDRQHLTSSSNIIFKITHNDSVAINLSEFKLPLNNESIVGSVALSGQPINIANVNDFSQNVASGYNVIKHDSSIDRRTGYQCKSMLTVPMFDISHSVIGIIQLINCKIGEEPLLTEQDFEKRVIPFDDMAVEYSQIIAHQAGIALENAILTQDKQNLFESFVMASIKAIEQRDPTTSGHSYRVCKLTLQLAKVVNSLTEGPFKDVHFSDEELKEIEFAAILHDFGKFAVREDILLKANKLFDWQLEVIKNRFELAKIYVELDYLKEILMYIQNPFLFPTGLTPKSFELKKLQKIEELNNYLEFIIESNKPSVLEKSGFDKLKTIANTKFVDLKGKEVYLLTQEELNALSISKGSLTAKEITEIRNHVVHTYEFLKSISWGKNLSNIPEIAFKHHEMLDGSGYPNGCNASQIPIQSRMLAIADIFDALTASDRPYKKAVPIDKALAIIEKDAIAGKYDIDLFSIFKEYKCYEVIKERV